MVALDVKKVFDETVGGLFQAGSRYYAEKIGVIVGLVVLSIASVVWSFSGYDDTNELGAEIYLRDVVVAFDLFLQNTGSSDWTEVRIVLDQKYLFTADRIEGGESLTVGPADLAYFYHVPRPWGREDWEELAQDQKPELNPESSYVPSTVQIRSRQGRLDVELEEVERRN